MINCDNLFYAYPSGSPALRNINLSIPDGAFVLVTGVSGSGKSTLLRALNGLVPHFYGGRFGGSVQVDGHNTLMTPPRTLARTIGFVAQDPETQFVVQTVEDEIAFGLENQGVPPEEMRQRIAQILDTLGIAHLRRRRISTLSGGEGQRVAIASALVLTPKHLVLDEPTSQLDPLAAHALLDSLIDLNTRYGLTIILAEHRLERVLRYATHLLHLDVDANGQTLHFGPVREILPTIALRPPVVEAAIHLGWQPLPLSVDEARAFVPLSIPEPISAPTWSVPTTDLAIEVRDLAVGYPQQAVLSNFNWSVQRGEIVGLLGVNGAGKSTFLKTLIGLLKPAIGTIRLMGMLISGRKTDILAHTVGYVPQNPNSVLFAETLRDEMLFTLRNHGLPGDGSEFLARLGLAGFAERYPRDLSGGERQRAALAAMLVAEPPVVLLDEPTRGLDYLQKQRLSDLLRGWSERGITVVVATHDVEWIAGLATRATILANGKIVADGPANQIILQTTGFKTQLGELFQRSDLLTPAALDKLRTAAVPAH